MAESSFFICSSLLSPLTNQHTVSTSTCICCIMERIQVYVSPSFPMTVETGSLYWSHNKLPVLICLKIKYLICSIRVPNNVFILCWFSSYYTTLHYTSAWFAFEFVPFLPFLFSLSVQLCCSSAIMCGTFYTHTPQSTCNTLTKLLHHVLPLYYSRCSPPFFKVYIISGHRPIKSVWK